MIVIGSRIDEEAKSGIAGRSTVQWLQQNGQCTIVKMKMMKDDVYCKKRTRGHTHTRKENNIYMERI